MTGFILAMPKEAKRACCCCGELVSARTEQRHLQGQAPPRVKAAQAQMNRSRGLLKSLAAAPKAIRKYFSPKISKASSSQVISQSAHTPDVFDNPPAAENQAVDSADTTMNDGQDHIDTDMVDLLDEDESNPDNGDDAQLLAGIVNGAEQGTWGGPRSRRATVEEYESDDEADAKSTLSVDTDHSFISDWDQKADGLAIEEAIDEDFERELADFGMFSLKLKDRLLLTCYPLKRKGCQKMISILYVSSRSKPKSISPTKRSINSNTRSLIPTLTV